MDKGDPGSGEVQRRVGVREFRGDLTGFLRLARQGQSFLITSHDEVVAELRPPAVTERPKRVPGTMRGEIKMAEDFDSFPDDILDLMEGRTE